LWCAYAVVGPVDEAVRRATGESLELVGDDDVAVVVGRVPQSEYGEDVLPSRLNDRQWLGRAVTEHEQVVRSMLGTGAVVPLRFGSLYRDIHAVEEFLSTHREEFLTSLARLRDRVELGVKVWVAAPGDGGRQGPAPTGREYLERRRAEREEAARARATLDERLRAIHARLLAAADDGVLNRPQPKELSGDRREMAINAAYLVTAGGEALLAEVERLRAEHDDLELEVTGPWAPYNFVEGREP
jgi:hypothetical protein